MTDDVDANTRYRLMVCMKPDTWEPTPVGWLDGLHRTYFSTLEGARKEAQHRTYRWHFNERYAHHLEQLRMDVVGADDRSRDRRQGFVWHPSADERASLTPKADILIFHPRFLPTLVDDDSESEIAIAERNFQYWAQRFEDLSRRGAGGEPLVRSADYKRKTRRSGEQGSRRIHDEQEE